MLKYVFPSFFSLLSISIVLSASHASITFEDYRGLSNTEEYIRIWAPDISEEEIDRLGSLFNGLVNEGSTPILEDNPPNSLDNLGIPQFESGHSYSPIMEIQGPLLAAWYKFNTCRLLDIGPGSGNDTIMARACKERGVVLSADIHLKQIQQLRERVKENLGNNLGTSFKSFRRDFSEKDSVPSNYISKFKILNANKVFHFLNEEQTRNMVENAYALLEEEGLFFITVSQPPLFLVPTFNQRKSEGVVCPGLIHYDTMLGNYTRRTPLIPPLKEILSIEEDTLPPTLGHKIEFLKELPEGDTFLTLRQGRHFHDRETLFPFLTSHFNIIDSTEVTAPDGEFFLSVIAQKNPI